MPLGSIAQFPFGGGLTAANLNAPVNSLKVLLDGYVDNGATFAGMTVPMIASTPGIRLQQPATTTPDFMQFYAANGTTQVGKVDFAGNFVGNSVTANAFAGQLQPVASGLGITQTPGTKLATFGTPYAGRNAEWAIGTTGAPLTTAGSLLKISGTFDQAASIYPSSNAGVTEGSAGIAVHVQNKGTTGAQIAGVFASVQGNGTTTGADAVALYGIATALSSATTGAAGAYLQGQRNSATGIATGAEIRVQNESGVDDTYTGVAAEKTMAVWATSSGTGGKKNSVAFGAGNAGSPFRVGFSAFATSVSDVSFDDQSSSTTSFRAQGTHAGYAFDTKGGTFATVGSYQAAIRLGGTHGIYIRNNGDSGDLLALAKNAGDQFIVGGALIVDTAGSISAPGTITAGSGSHNITNAAGFINGASLLAGSAPVAGLAPGYVTATGTTMVLTAAPFTMVSSAGVPISSSGGTTTVTAPPTSGWSWVTVVYADDAGVIQHIDGAQAASSPPQPTLPANAIPLARLTIVNGTTAITQAMLGEFRQVLAPTQGTLAATVGAFHATGAATFDSTIAMNGTVSSAIGLVMTSSINSSGNASGFNMQGTLRPASGSNAYGMASAPTIDTSVGTVPFSAAFFANTYAKSGANPVTNAYGFYGVLPTAGTTGNYAAYFGGPVGINQPSPTAGLHVLPSTTAQNALAAYALAGQATALIRFDSSTAVTNGTVNIWDANGHLWQTSGAAPVASGLGTNVTSVTCTGTDQFGIITVVTSGAVTANATLATITYATACTNAPKQASLVPGNSATWGLANAAQLTAATIGATTWLLKAGTTGAGAGTYVYTYIVV
jgi:hypothetical protein